MIRKTKIFWRFILLTLINSLLSVILQHFFCKISFSIVKRNSTMSTLYISLTCIMRCWYPKQFKGKHCLSQPLYLLILIRYYSQHLYILSISTNLTCTEKSKSFTSENFRSKFLKHYDLLLLLLLPRDKRLTESS